MGIPPAIIQSLCVMGMRLAVALGLGLFLILLALLVTYLGLKASEFHSRLLHCHEPSS